MHVHLARSCWRSPRTGAAGPICSASCRVRGAPLAPASPGQRLLRAGRGAGTAPARCPARPLLRGYCRHGHGHKRGHRRRQCSSGGQSLASGHGSALLVVILAGRNPRARFWRLMFPVPALTAAAHCTRKKTLGDVQENANFTIVSGRLAYSFSPLLLLLAFSPPRYLFYILFLSL